MSRINIYSIKQIRESTVTYDYENTITNTPRNSAELIYKALDVATSDREMFGVVNLNAKLKVNGVHVVSVGNLTESLAHPREVYKLAVLNNAHSIVVWHNHPSGDLRPSQIDIAVTRTLVAAGQVLGINLLDHVILGRDGGYYSLLESGEMPPKISF